MSFVALSHSLDARERSADYSWEFDSDPLFLHGTRPPRASVVFPLPFLGLLSYVNPGGEVFEQSTLLPGGGHGRYFWVFLKFHSLFSNFDSIVHWLIVLSTDSSTGRVVPEQSAPLPVDLTIKRKRGVSSVVVGTYVRIPPWFSFVVYCRDN